MKVSICPKLTWARKARCGAEFVADHEILRLTDDDRRLLIAMRIACRLLHSVESAENPPLPDIAEIPSLREQVFSDLKKRQHTWS